MFCDPLAIHQLDPDSDDEERFVAVGMGSAGIVMVVIYTLRGEEIRLISAQQGRRRIAVNLRLTEPGAVAQVPIDRFDGLNTFEDLPRDGRCVADYWF